MVVGQLAERADLVVVGGGPGGYAAALRAAQTGRSVTLVETGGAAALGGSCVHVGCIPSKSLIEVAETRHRVAQAGAQGLSGIPEFSAARFQAWKDAVVEDLAGGIGKLLAGSGVAVRQGTARFVAHRRIAVDDGTSATYLEFTDLVLAPGSQPVSLPDVPVDGERVLDSTGALALARVPASLTVLGGGYVGVELATAFAKLGSTVTVVEQRDRLLPTLDPALGRAVHRGLVELGISVRLNTSAIGIDEHDLVVSGEPDAITAEVVVVAVGRRPTTADLGLDRAAITPSPTGHLPVGADRLVAPHIAAIGDVTSGPALAHKATAEALVAVDVLGGLPREFDPRAVPCVVFSDPEVATAGLTESQARETGIDAASYRFPLSASGRAATLGRRSGFAELVVERSSSVVLGVHLCGPHASELIAEGVLAVETGATVDDLAYSIHPHPTLSEQLTEVAHLAAGTPLSVLSTSKPGKGTTT